MQDPVVPQIAAQRAAVLGVLADPPADAWSRPTVCDGWSVKDVLAHLVEGELGVGRVYRREVVEQGYVDPQEGIDRWRPLPGAAVRAAFWQHGVASQRVLDAMTDEVWRAPIKAYGCREMRQLVRLHLFDLCVHGHDLTDALGAEPVWGPSLPFLTEFVVRAAPPTFARRDHAPEGRVVVVVPALGRRWTLDGSGDRWAVEHDPGEERADATITIDPETLVLLTTGRLATPPALELSGDASLAERILAAWRVV